MSKLAICLWFDTQAQDAADFYIATFRAAGRKAGFGDRMHYTEAGPRPSGSVLSVTFTLDGQDFLGLNGGPHYTFSPAISMFVTCEDQAEVDHFWNALIEGGQPSRCGWLTDRFGVSWQIVPSALGRMLQDADRAAASRAMQAMLTMVKLDVAALQAAFDRGE